jgi:hypothetical protein
VNADGRVTVGNSSTANIHSMPIARPAAEGLASINEAESLQTNSSNIPRAKLFVYPCRHNLISMHVHTSPAAAAAADHGVTRACRVINVMPGTCCRGRPLIPLLAGAIFTQSIRCT